MPRCSLRTRRWGDNDEEQVTPMEDDAVVHEEDAAVVQLIEVTGKCGPPLA